MTFSCIIKSVADLGSGVWGGGENFKGASMTNLIPPHAPLPKIWHPPGRKFQTIHE